MIKTAMRIFRSDPKVTESEMKTFKERVSNNKGNFKKLTKDKIVELGELAPSYVRVYYNQHMSRVQFLEEKKNEGADVESEEIKRELKKVQHQRFAEDLEDLKKSGFLTLEGLSAKEKAWFEKNVASDVEEVNTISDLSDPALKADEKEEEEREKKEVFPVTSASPSAAISTMSVIDLIDWLGDGLQYDKFSSEVVRKELFGKPTPPTLNEMITMVSAYIFVGNNASKLTSKVKVVSVGTQALGVLNKFGIVSKKADSKSLTLARIGIVLSPVVWALRNILNSKGKIQTAGVNTTTPKEMQDVSLSGVSQFIPGGEGIMDFLVKFNEVLIKAKEKGTKDKTTTEDMKAQAEKYHNLAKEGAKEDKVLSNWKFNSPESKEVDSIVRFYNICLDEARVGE